MIDDIKKALMIMRDSRPVILNLTNYVAMEFIANSLLALGACPIMSVYSKEIEELAIISSAISINIGTLDDVFIQNCRAATSISNKSNKPMVLDPVGSGATIIRTRFAKKLAKHASIVKGNASEIMAISGAISTTKGVEATTTVDQARDHAISLAQDNQCTVVISGPVDFVTDGSRHVEVPFGSQLMPFVTGMGCTLTAVLAAFRSVVDDSFQASVLGTYYFALCGELAAGNARYPGSFRTDFIDNLNAVHCNKMRDIYDK